VVHVTADFEGLVHVVPKRPSVHTRAKRGLQMLLVDESEDGDTEGLELEAAAARVAAQRSHGGKSRSMPHEPGGHASQKSITCASSGYSARTRSQYAQGSARAASFTKPVAVAVV